MKYEIELNGTFVVDLNFWSGKCKLSYENMELIEDGKNTFYLGSEKVSVGGTLFSGVYLIRGDDRALIAKLHWYDYIACLLPFFVGLIGSYIGAALGIICFFLCYKLMPYVKNVALRMLMCVGIAAAVLLVVLVLATLFPTLFGLEGK